MRPLTIGRLRISAIVERTGPTRPTWLLPDAVPEALERHREWLNHPTVGRIVRHGEAWRFRVATEP